MIKTELAKRKLPNLFQIRDGKQISDKSEWEQLMRPYWKDMVCEHVFGKVPPYVKPMIDVCDKTEEDYRSFGGKANWWEIIFTFEYNGKRHAVPAQLLLPRTSEKCPVFVYMNFHSEIPSKYLPAEEIIDGGFGIFNVGYNDVTMDNDDFSNGLAGLFSVERRNFANSTNIEPADNVEENCEGQMGTEAGKIMYWAYMAMHMMDYLQTREDVDCEMIGIAGHSRLGKTALLASALDERFAFVCANESGCSGAALSRGCTEGGERVIDIYKKFPFWFCEKYGTYAEEPETLPLDQHCLIALSAPRMVVVSGAAEDLWADNNSQFLACAAASPAWELYGKQGLTAPDRYPECGDNFGEGNIGFYLRAGDHFHSRYDWNACMQLVRNYFEKEF